MSILLRYFYLVIHRTQRLSRIRIEYEFIKTQVITIFPVEHVDAAPGGSQLQRQPEPGLRQRQPRLQPHSRQLHGQRALNSLNHTTYI